MRYRETRVRCESIRRPVGVRVDFGLGDGWAFRMHFRSIVVLGLIGLIGFLSVAENAQAARAGDWFWRDVPAKIKDGTRSRAISVIRSHRARGRQMFGTRAKVERIMQRWGREITAGARTSRIPEKLLASIVLAESGGNPRALSPAGAQGLAQLMPGTARRFGVNNSYDPAQNLRGAAAYLSFLLKRFKGDLVLVVAAYNAGEHAVDRHGGVPPYRETRNYVPRVLSAFEAAGAVASSYNPKAYKWFWDSIPTKLRGGSRSNALELVRTQRANGRRMFGSKPDLRRILKRWGPQIEKAAERGKISEALLAGVVAASGGNPRSVSPFGGKGLGHLPPEIIRKYKVKDPFNVEQNLRGTAAYLSDLIDTYRGDLVMALAAYNAGAASVRQYKGVPPFGETREFVPRVLSAFDLAGSFCATPPDAARRKCELQ